MRLIDADALLRHSVEADRMGAMLVVGIGHIFSAPTVSLWVKTSDRLPTKEDAGPEKCVIYCRRWDKGVYTELREWDSFKHYPYDDGEVVYWMPLPKLPEVEG